MSDSELGFLQRVWFWIQNFTTRQILKKNIFYKVRFWRKSIFKKHDFEEKNIFEKQILKKFLHTKNHVLTHFTP